jgi:hypothetical protein
MYFMRFKVGLSTLSRLSIFVVGFLVVVMERVVRDEGGKAFATRVEASLRKLWAS